MPKADFAYYLENRDTLNSTYDGQVVVIQNKKVVAQYPSLDEAYDQVYDLFEEGTFLLQPCSTSQEPVLKYSLSSRRLT